MSTKLLILLGLGGFLLVFLITLVVIFVKTSYKQKQKSSAEEKYLTSIGVDVSKVKDTIRDTVRSEMNFACTARPPCELGYMVEKNSKGESCCYVNPEKTKPTKEEQKRTMMKDIAEELIITEGTELIITMLPKIYKAIKNPIVAAKAIKGAAIAAKVAMKALIKNGSKIALKTLAAAPLKLGMGPVGWAMLAFDIVSAALDIYDPVGYETFMSNEVAMNLRNIAEHSFQRMHENEGQSTPALADFDYRNPSGQFATRHVEKVIQSRMYAKAIENMPVEIQEAFEEKDIVGQQIYLGDEVGKLIEAYMDTVEYKKEICETYRNQRGNRHKVEWIKDVGCSMTASECRRFNDYESRNDPDNQSFALFTKRYRKKIGGSVKKPKVKTYKLRKEACILSNMRWAKEACTKDKGRWNEDEAMCSFSRRYCSKMGLSEHRMKNHVNNCIMYPGQRIAEMFFGKTVTRLIMSTGDKESYKALLEGDLSVLKGWGQTLAFISLGPTGMALAIGLKMGGVDVDLTKYTPIGAIMNPDVHKAIGDGFEDAAKAFEDRAKEYTDLLKNGVEEMLKNIKKLAKISKNLGPEAAKQVARMGQKGIDQVEDLIGKMPIGQIGNAVKGGLNEIENAWKSIFSWLPF